MRRKYVVAITAIIGLMLSTAQAATDGVVTPTRVAFETLPVLMSTTASPDTFRVHNDFDGDGTSDLLWFNPSSSQLAYWLMGRDRDREIAYKKEERAFNVTTGYFVGAVADFNGDSFADIFFTSAARDLWLWTNNRHGGWVSTRVANYPDQWQLIGAGDVNGDGYDDLLWLDPSECKFAYWLMYGGTRIGSRIIDVACGYYPLSVGYYSPSSHISILWTSPLNDLYVWDGGAAGFASYDLTPYLPRTGGMASVWSIGGGYKGGADVGFGSFPIGIERREVDGLNSTWILTRQFDLDGKQGLVYTSQWDDNSSDAVGPAGYLIQGMHTGLYLVDIDDPWIGVNFWDLESAPWPVKSHFRTSWTFPRGWYVVGAPANNTVVPPWP